MALTQGRRRFLIFAGVTILLLAVASAILFLRNGEAVEPFYGSHQAGIATPPQKFAFVAAFDVTVDDAVQLRDLLVAWTKAAAALTQGLPRGSIDTPSEPAEDTGETLGYKPARLTVTFGAGPSLFDARFGLADRRPPALVPLPPFPGDSLNPDWSDGDLVVQVCADDFQTAYHAIHNLTRVAKGVAVPRWVQTGFQPGLEVNAKGPGRNLQGFTDGTENPDVADAKTMERVVWMDEPAWMRGGSFLVVRRIRMFVETWDRTALADQERTIGRERMSGRPLPAQAEDSHVRLARGDGATKIFRRPYSYVNGLDVRTGQWDAGLLFLAWMKDPTAQFVPMQQRLASNDALNEYIQNVGSAVFAVFPGAAEGDFVGSGLFPQPLAERIEGLQARIGALYPALNNGNWEAVRMAFAEWDREWRGARNEAGKRTADIDSLRNAWAAALAPSEPDGPAVRLVQSNLIAALVAWGKAVAPKMNVSAASLDGLKRSAAAAERSVAQGDWPSARKAFAEFQLEWTVKEALVRNLDQNEYGDIELRIGAARRALQSESKAQAAPALASLSGSLASLRPPRTFTAWDAAIILFREGLEALLVLASLLAFVSKTGRSSSAVWVWSGAGLGLASSVAVAILVSLAMTAWMASTPELVEGLAGLVAVALMLAVGGWLHGKAVMKNWNLWIKQRMDRSADSPFALAALAFLAVLREGAETVVFLWGMAGTLPIADLLVGMAVGLAVLSVLGVLMLGFSKRLPLKWFFPVATLLIYFLAVKILGQSVAALQAAGWIGGTYLGFGRPIEWLGFSPTWETAVPQILLALVLASLVLFSVRKGTVKPGRGVVRP